MNSLVLVILSLLMRGSFSINAYHKHSMTNGADIAFPDDQRTIYGQNSQNINSGVGYKPAYSSQYNNTSEMISIPFLEKISNFTVSDLLLNYVDEYEEDTFLTNRFGEEVERSPAITPKAATCMPELKTIQLVESVDPSIIYLPMCTRIEKCGGCCSHNLLSCQPTETETVSFKVVKTQFTVGNRLKFVGKEVVHVEKHTKCKCSCKIKAEDCNSFQEYRTNECKCSCLNKDEERKCHMSNETKLWDPTSCTCRCRDVNSCSTGYTFDGNTCKCAPIPVRRRYIQTPKNQDEEQQFQEELPASAYYETSNLDE